MVPVSCVQCTETAAGSGVGAEGIRQIGEQRPLSSSEDLPTDLWGVWSSGLPRLSEPP